MVSLLQLLWWPDVSFHSPALRNIKCDYINHVAHCCCRKIDEIGFILQATEILWSAHHIDCPVQAERQVTSQEICHLRTHVSVNSCMDSSNTTLMFILTIYVRPFTALTSFSTVFLHCVCIFSHSGWKHPSVHSRASHPALHRSRWFRLKRQKLDSSLQKSGHKLKINFMWGFSCHVCIYVSPPLMFPS